jgi:hypothetical protein
MAESSALTSSEATTSSSEPSSTTVVVVEEHYALTLFAFKAVEKGDLSFEANELLKLDTHQGDWWTGTDSDGYFGQFPAACE